MAMQCIGPSYGVRGSQSDKTQINLLTPQTAVASPGARAAESNPNLMMISPLSVYLNLEDLKCFEVVDSQFRDYGITLQNAIALLPSNPAYPTRTSTNVLMGAPKNGWIEASFSQAIRKFCCYVTSSQRTIISAYDHQDKLLARQSLSGANLAGFDSHLPPNTQLLIEEPNISRITLYAFDGQLTACDLSFEF